MNPLDLLKEKLPSIFEELKGEAPAFVALLESKGYKLMQSYQDQAIEAYKDMAVLAETLEEREDARQQYKALRVYRALPEMLLHLIKSLDQEPDPDSQA